MDIYELIELSNENDRLSARVRELEERLREKTIYAINCKLGNVDPSESEVNAALFEAQQRIAELEQEQRWIPVEERLPEEGVDVLVIQDHGDTRRISVYPRDRWWEMNNVTHWKPITPPTEES